MPNRRARRRIFAWVVAAGSLAGCHRSAAPPPVNGAPPPAATRLGAALLDPADRCSVALKEAAGEAHAELRVESAEGRLAAQSRQVLTLLDEKVSALLLVPGSPDLLHSVAEIAAAKSVPLVTIGRGDGSVGGWVGLRSGTLAREAGEAAARRLRAAGVTRPRVIVVETTRWPETTRRNEAVLAPLQREFGSLDLPVRLRNCETEAETRDLLVEGLPRLVSVDAIVAAEPATTAGALAAVKEMRPFDRTLIVGVTDDAELAASARAADSRLVLVSFRPADLAQKAVGAALRAAKGGEKPAIEEVAAELVEGKPAAR
jgi:ABC-type sugar transport system substrate-binding protein